MIDECICIYILQQRIPHGYVVLYCVKLATVPNVSFCLSGAGRSCTLTLLTA